MLQNKIVAHFHHMLLSFTIVIALSSVPSSIACIDLLHTYEHSSITLTEQLLELRGKPLQRKIVASSPIHGDTIEVFGVPRTVEKHTPLSGNIYRHYFATSDAYQAVLISHELKAGPVPYARIAANVYREYYLNLEGIFVTTPDFRPEQVGLEKSASPLYIDFHLPTNIGMLQIEPGIFLIPGKATLPAWIVEKYRAHQANPSVAIDPGLKHAFQKIEATRNSPELVVGINPI